MNEYWCVFSDDGRVWPWTIAGTRRDSIDKNIRALPNGFLGYVGIKPSWSFLYRRGYRCKRVRIVEVDGE